MSNEQPCGLSEGTMKIRRTSREKLEINYLDIQFSRLELFTAMTKTLFFRQLSDLVESQLVDPRHSIDNLCSFEYCV